MPHKNYPSIQAIVLAAGKASRFKTKKTKLLFSICGQPMILYPLKALQQLHIPTTLVLGYQADQIKQEIESNKLQNVSFVLQEEQRGTGHAVACSQDKWSSQYILIMNGDCPLITPELINEFIIQHEQEQAPISLMTTMVIDPKGYGRIIEKNGKLSIIEDRDCTEKQRHINRINTGIYLINKTFLEENITKITTQNLSHEFYLTDLISLASEQGLPVNTMQVPYDNVRGVNTLQELWSVEQIKRSDLIKHWMSEGVQFELAQSIHIDLNVSIGAGSFIGTGVHLLGNTIIGEECIIKAFSIIEDSIIGDSTTVHSHSVIQKSTLGEHVEVGPFARLRTNTKIKNNVVIGNFVETKEVSINESSKAKHLSYLGNAEIGSSVNIGAGTIICNFDGTKKNTTVIEDNAFVGSNNTIIAPVCIGKNSYTAAGSTINRDVPEESLAIGRAQQHIKKNYAQKLRKQQQPSTTSEQEKKSFQGATQTHEIS